MLTSVINIRQAPANWQSDPRYVYIGRAGKGQDGYFGNPFPLLQGESRGATLDRFREWAKNKLSTDPEFARRVSELKGKTLICFCAPNSGLQPALDGDTCHGQILAHYAETL
jgi:hypothetical protein